MQGNSIGEHHIFGIFFLTLSQNLPHCNFHPTVLSFVFMLIPPHKVVSQLSETGHHFPL